MNTRLYTFSDLEVTMVQPSSCPSPTHTKHTGLDGLVTASIIILPLINNSGKKKDRQWNKSVKKIFFFLFIEKINLCKFIK